MDIVVLGSGNVATHFAQNFHQQGHKIKQIFSRAKANAQALAFAVHADSIIEISEMQRNADLYVIAVSDQAISSLIMDFPIDLSGIVVHCSGATEMDVLHKFKHYGVIYPPQSISKNEDSDFSQIPFCIEEIPRKYRQLY